VIGRIWSCRWWIW